MALDPSSISELTTAWKFTAVTPTGFSKPEFMDGMTELGYDRIEKPKSQLPKMEQDDLQIFTTLLLILQEIQNKKGLGLEFRALWKI